MAAFSAREQITARRGVLRVRTEINLKGEPLKHARLANELGCAHMLNQKADSQRTVVMLTATAVAAA
jgi:hypothetical protein